MPKRLGIVALNPASEAFARYCELMPAVTDVRGEKVAFDLGSYSRAREIIVERRRQLDIAYFADKDVLDVIILPNRPSVVGGGEHGFLIHYDREHNHEISGFEILDFSDFIPHLYEPGVVPALSMRFEVQKTTVSVDPDGTVHRHTVDTDLQGVTLHEALEWAYHEYVLADHPRLVASPAEMAA